MKCCSGIDKLVTARLLDGNWLSSRASMLKTHYRVSLPISVQITLPHYVPINLKFIFAIDDSKDNFERCTFWFQNGLEYQFLTRKWQSNYFGKHVIRKNPLHFPIQVILVELCQVKQLKEKNKKFHLPIFRCCGPKMKCTFVYCPIRRVTAELTLLSMPKLPRCTPGLNRLLIIQDRVSLHKIFWVSIIPQC